MNNNNNNKNNTSFTESRLIYFYIHKKILVKDIFLAVFFISRVLCTYNIIIIYNTPIINEDVLCNIDKR